MKHPSRGTIDFTIDYPVLVVLVCQLFAHFIAFESIAKTSKTAGSMSCLDSQSLICQSPAATASYLAARTIDYFASETSGSSFC